MEYWQKSAHYDGSAILVEPVTHSAYKDTFMQMLKQWETLQMFVDFGISSRFPSEDGC